MHNGLAKYLKLLKDTVSNTIKFQNTFFKSIDFWF